MSTDLFDLSGKIALVTGGSRGLGLRMVRAFAEHGADIVIASRKLDACEAAGVRRVVLASTRRWRKTDWYAPVVVAFANSFRNS